MGFLSIGIKRWVAWATHFEGLSEQQISVDCGNITISQEFGLRPASVKPMLLRRLSPLGRTALWCAEQATGDEKLSDCACVFASQHGEVARTTDILRAYYQTGEVSPTSFSLSVHNAISGIYSIANGIHGNITAIAAGEDSLMMALLESSAILRSATVGHVLCVAYDQPVPGELNRYQTSPDFGFVVALLLDKSATHQISLEGGAAGFQKTAHQFSCVINYLLGRSGAQQKIVSQSRSWQIRAYQESL